MRIEPCNQVQESGFLIVDDDADIRELVADVLQDALQSEGYAVHTAANGKEALTELTNSRSMPSLVLLDMMMPVMCGADLLLALRKLPRFAEPPVVVLTAHEIPERIAGARVRRLLRKPVSLEALASLAQEFCGSGHLAL